MSYMLSFYIPTSTLQGFRASLSSGLEAAQFSTFKELRRPEFCSKTLGEWSITC